MIFINNIITDLAQLARPAQPLKFLTSTGMELDEGKQIIKQLKEAMMSNPQILALAAPQIGIDARIFGIKFNDVIKIFINPIITKKKGAEIAPETFVSMPGKEILISRPKEITVVYYTEEFKYEDNKLIGFAARLFDQQAQLLDGILPDALGLVSDVEQDGSLLDLSESEIVQLLDIYKQFITAKTKSIEKDINQDEEQAKQFAQLKYTEKVINGDIVVVEDPEQTQKKANQQKRFASTMQKSLTKQDNILHATLKTAQKIQLSKLQKKGKHNKKRKKGL